jgi:hypothetical protein
MLYGVDPYSKVVGADFQQQRLVATLTTRFGVLAAVGFFGVQAYMVERRTGEIGLRKALGAARGRVVRMVLAARDLATARLLNVAQTCKRQRRHLFGLPHRRSNVAIAVRLPYLLCSRSGSHHVNCYGSG